MSLQDMLNDSPDQIDAIDSNKDQIQDQIDELDEEITSVTDELCTVVANNLATYLDSTKVIELTYIDATAVVYNSDYGDIEYELDSIEHWSIVDSTGNVVYQYEGINWDSDSIIQKYIDDFNFGNDYLTRPLTSGATYGLIPNKTALETAKSILTENKNKVSNSQEVFGDYV